MNEVLFALWFFLPAGIANVAPILAAVTPGLKKWNTPVDFGHTYKGEAIFGPHKTIRGFVCGIIAGILVFQLQIYSFEHYQWAQDISLNLNYSQLTPIVLGGLLGFGALFGDSLKSFFKRRAGVNSGKSWFPFDQLDYIAGGIIFSLIIVQLSFIDYLVIIAVWFLMHLISSYIGYKLKLKVDPI